MSSGRSREEILLEVARLIREVVGEAARAHLRNRKPTGRYDQDLRFGSEGLKDAFFLVAEVAGGNGAQEKFAAVAGVPADGEWSEPAARSPAWVIGTSPHGPEKAAESVGGGKRGHAHHSSWLAKSRSRLSAYGHNQLEPST